MQDFNIVRKSELEKTYRVARVLGDFDLNVDSINEEFKGEIELPKCWNIGIIVGNSGTGKTTIAKELFKDYITEKYSYNSKSAIDDMPKNKSVDEITKMFYAVGFGSVPSWLKPYSVLSNGEKMRVDLARSLLEKDIVCFDEFTSVIDRNVARTMCIAINKAIKAQNKKFIAVTCHYDITNWLEYDWCFDTNNMKMFFQDPHINKKNIMSEDVGLQNGTNLGSIII